MEPDRLTPSIKSRASTARRTAPSSAKVADPVRERSSSHKKRNPSLNQEKFDTDRTAHTMAHESQLKSGSFTTFLEAGNNREELQKLWRSTIAGAPVATRLNSKRNPHTAEHLHILRREPSMHNRTVYQQQVLPNVRSTPKSKLLHKGLAYKEVKKFPGVVPGYKMGNAKELDPSRSMRTINVGSISTLKHDQATKSHTSLDLREIRKRIIRGNTLAYQSSALSTSSISGRSDLLSTLDIEVLLPIRGLSTCSHAPLVSPQSYTAQLQAHLTLHNTPVLPQQIASSTIGSVTHISSL